MPRSLLTGIIQPRIEEIFELVRSRLEASGFDKAAGRRVVLTGGASQLTGVRDLAQLVLDKQVRQGRPIGLPGLAEATGGPAFFHCDRAPAPRRAQPGRPGARRRRRRRGGAGRGRVEPAGGGGFVTTFDDRASERVPVREPGRPSDGGVVRMDRWRGEDGVERQSDSESERDPRP